MKLSRLFTLFLFSILPFVLFGQRKSKKKDRFDVKLGLNYTVNNFSEERLNGSYDFPNFERNSRIGFSIKPEYKIAKFLSFNTGLEVLGYKISFDEIAYIGSPPFQLHNHRLKVLEGHIPFELNYKQRIKKGQYLYFGAGYAMRFILSSKGEIENLSTLETTKDRIDFRVRVANLSFANNIKGVRFNLGYEWIANKKIPTFIEVGYRNIPLTYFYGGSNNAWSNDIIIDNNLFLNLTIGVKI